MQRGGERKEAKNSDRTLLLTAHQHRLMLDPRNAELHEELLYGAAKTSEWCLRRHNMTMSRRRVLTVKLLCPFSFCDPLPFYIFLFC
jgi:hypothetical protein